MLSLTIRQPLLAACLLLSLGLLALASFLPSAYAQESPDEPSCPSHISPQSSQSAQDLTLYGVSCFEAQRYDWALTYYRRAFSLKPGPLLLGAIGRSLHELGLYGPALAQYEAFLKTTPEPAGADRIRNRVAQLRQAQARDGGKVKLLSSPAGARAHLVLENGDWFPLGKTPVELKLQAGTYEFVFEDDHYRPRKEPLSLKAGQQLTLNSELVHHSATFDLSTRQWRRAGAWTLGVSTPIAAAGLTLFALSAKELRSARDLEDHFNDLQDFDQRRAQALDRAGSLRTWAIISTAVGTTGLITGALLFSLPRKASASKDTNSAQITEKWRLEPLANFNYLGLRLHF